LIIIAVDPLMTTIPKAQNVPFQGLGVVDCWLTDG